MSDEQNFQQNHYIKVSNKYLEILEHFKHLGTNLMNQICMKKLRAD
jgi:hypothetical protein